MQLGLCEYGTGHFREYQYHWKFCIVTHSLDHFEIETNQQMAMFSEQLTRNASIDFTETEHLYFEPPY